MKRISRIPNLPKKNLHRIFKMIPVSSVELVIHSKKGILLAKRDVYPFKGYWHLPGGLVHYNEKIKDTVKRVAKRETGLKVKIVRYVGTYDYIGMDPRGHMIAHAFLVNVKGGRLQGSELGKEVKFFDKIPKKFIYYQREIVKDSDVLK